MHYDEVEERIINMIREIVHTNADLVKLVQDLNNRVTILEKELNQNGN